MLPFTSEQFIGVFEQYNETVWPAQVVIYIAAISAFYLILRPDKYSNKVVSGILALFWLWMGIIYHWLFFASINPTAHLFGALFAVQGLIFIYEGIIKKNLIFSFSKDWRSATGILLMLFGPLIYPILGYFLGHTYPSSPTFGLPCPTTIFTIGALLLANRPPRYVAVIPLLWSAIGFSASISLGVKEDIFLLIAGLIGVVAIMFRRTKVVQKIDSGIPESI
jgi:FtsH-binding integral membrane protein